jgi:hypothetical protein
MRLQHFRYDRLRISLEMLEQSAVVARHAIEDGALTAGRARTRSYQSCTPLGSVISGKPQQIEEPLPLSPAQMPSRSHRFRCLPAAEGLGATRSAAAELTHAAMLPIPSRRSHSSLGEDLSLLLCGPGAAWPRRG